MVQRGKDWIFSDEKSICHFRVAGVLIENDKLLVQKEINNDVYAIPGGHVSFGETSEDTLVREFKEEAGMNVLVNRLIWVEENFWKWGKKDAHNITFYYLVSLIGTADFSNKPMKDNSNVFLRWVTFDELKELTIYPPFIKDKVSNISANIEHFVRNSW